MKNPASASAFTKPFSVTLTACAWSATVFAGASLVGKATAQPASSMAVATTIPRVSSPFDVAAAALEEALATGNSAQIDAITRAQTTPAFGAANVALNTALARAWLIIGEPARALPFARAALADAPSDPVPKWLAAEAYYALRQWSTGDRLAAELKERDKDSPIIPYLQARYFLSRFADADAAFAQPMMVDAHQEAYASAEACSSAKARAHPDFDPRFLSAGIDVALFDLDYDAAAKYAMQLSALRPQNASLARLALTLSFSQSALLDRFLFAARALKTLPESELDKWEWNASLLTGAADARERAGVWLILAESVRKDPTFAPLYVHWIARAANTLPATDPEQPAAVNAYVDACLAARSAPHARRAVLLLKASPDDTDALRERRIQLAYLACRYDLAAELTLAEARAMPRDFEWLKAHRVFASRSQVFGAYIQYLRAMEALKPDDAPVLLELARVYEHHTMPGALDHYNRAFAAAPARVTPTFQDWLAYRNLINFTIGRGEAKANDILPRFDATTERIQKAATTDASAAQFYAELLVRRAEKTKKPADRDAANAAVERATALDPSGGEMLQALRKRSASWIN